MAQRNGEPPSAFGSSPQRGERESRASGREANDDRPLVTGPALGPIPYHWVAAIVVCVGTFLGVMDNTITNIALDTLTTEFDRPLDDVIWVALAFIVVSTGLSLTMGRMGDLYGRKKLYAWGYVVFTVATLLSSIAGSLEELVGSRVLQAVGAAMTMANGAAIITAAFPPSKRGTGLGLIVSTVGAGAAAGPILGGVLIDLLDWRAIFWTRVPFGLIAAVLAWRLLVDAPSEQRPKGLDVPGAILLFGMLACLTFGINRARDLGITSTLVTVVIAAGLVFMVWFIIVERRSPSPVVDLGLFKGRGFSFGILAAILQFFGLSFTFILGPIVLQAGRGFSPTETAMMMMPLSLMMLLWSPISGRLSDRFGSRPLTTAGMVIVCLALFLLSRTTADTSPVDFAMRMLLLGIGTSTFSSPNTSVIMSAVPPERLGTASASQTTARTFGNAFGTSVGVAIMTSVAASFALDHGVAAESGEAVMQGFRAALVVAALAASPAILFSLFGGQRGVRRVAERAAGKAVEGVRVVRVAIEGEISGMVPLFRGQKTAIGPRDGRNGAEGQPPLAVGDTETQVRS
ncbi:MAG: MFS transporter [Chloroflexi bacterium]|nr:MFS transporter [Chloroflexota bacterium]MCY3697165.1 MFS transporter [Chloroflexota bacterium]